MPAAAADGSPAYDKRLKIERLIRYYGVYSSRAQGVRRAERPELEMGSSEVKPLPTSWKLQWQQLLQRVFYVTLTCPMCPTEMKILSFISGSGLPILDNGLPMVASRIDGLALKSG